MPSLTSLQSESCQIPVVTIRKLSDATHRALKQRAVLHGRSTEAEIREILEATVRPANRVKIGSALAALGKRFGGPDLNITRDQESTKPAVFE